MELNGSGVSYPIIELGNQTYSLKVTRGVLYRLGKRGINILPIEKLDEGRFLSLQFTMLVDILAVVISFAGTNEQLAELVYDHQQDVAKALWQAWGNLSLPPEKVKLQGTAAEPVELTQ